MYMSGKLIAPERLRRLMYGLETPVWQDGGRMAAAVNLDNAATTPPFKVVADTVAEQLLFYGSVGRGAGQKSRHTSAVYEEGRRVILDFFGAGTGKYGMFYAANTTDGINKLASALMSPRDRYGRLRNTDILVVSTRMEHHANDLPWRERARTVYAEVGGDGRLVADDFERILAKPEYKDMTKYVTVTAASNVTGYVNDVRAIARVAHRYGARIIVDGAQIAAHRKFSLTGRSPEEDIDFFVFSAHKMYSPYGGGGVIGPVDVLNDICPQFYGGGMVESVSDDTVIYTDAPDLFEAGSPSVPAIVGMQTAAKTLDMIGFDYIEAHEQQLLRKALDALMAINKVVLYGDSIKIADRVGILVFNIGTLNPEYVAAQMAGRAGIALRHGAFCAHPYVRRLQQNPHLDSQCHPPAGMVRASFGAYTTEQDIDLLVRTADVLAKELGCSMAMGVNPRVPNDRG